MTVRIRDQRAAARHRKAVRAGDILDKTAQWVVVAIAAALTLALLYVLLSAAVYTACQAAQAVTR